MNLHTIRSLFFIALTLTFFNCGDDDSSSNSNGVQGTSKLTIKLVDDPGDFDHVYVDIIDVVIKVNDDSEDDNWQSI